MIKKIILLSIINLCFINNVDADSLIQGEWSKNCDSPFSRLYIDESGREAIELVFNQIHIYVKYKKENPNGPIDIFFAGVADLGRGGVMLNIPWDELETSTSIGSFERLDSDKAKLNWYGFKNSTGNSVEVMSGFSTEEVNELERCR